MVQTCMMLKYFDLFCCCCCCKNLLVSSLVPKAWVKIRPPVSYPGPHKVSCAPGTRCVSVLHLKPSTIRPRPNPSI